MISEEKMREIIDRHGGRVTEELKKDLGDVFISAILSRYLPPTPVVVPDEKDPNIIHVILPEDLTGLLEERIAL